MKEKKKTAEEKIDETRSLISSLHTTIEDANTSMQTQQEQLKKEVAEWFSEFPFTEGDWELIYGQTYEGLKLGLPFEDKLINVVMQHINLDSDLRYESHLRFRVGKFKVHSWWSGSYFFIEPDKEMSPAQALLFYRDCGFKFHKDEDFDTDVRIDLEHAQKNLSETQDLLAVMNKLEIK